MDYQKYRERYRSNKVGFSFWLDKEKDADIIEYLQTKTKSRSKSETIRDALRLIMRRKK